MDKPRRLLDPMEQQAEYDADFLKGYTGYIDGEPMTEGNGTPAWRDGWREAKQEITPTCW
jgi:hypothetical protein